MDVPASSQRLDSVDLVEASVPGKGGGRGGDIGRVVASALFVRAASREIHEAAHSLPAARLMLKISLRDGPTTTDPSLLVPGRIITPMKPGPAARIIPVSHVG